MSNRRKIKKTNPGYEYYNNIARLYGATLESVEPIPQDIAEEIFPGVTATYGGLSVCVFRKTK